MNERVTWVNEAGHEMNMGVRCGEQAASRADSAWDASEYRPGDRVDVLTLDLQFSVDELYAGITLDEA